MRHRLYHPTPSDLLWEVSGPSFPRPSFLFGTLHLECHPPWLRRVVRLLERGAWFASELDLLDREPLAPWTGPACRDVLGPRWGRVALGAQLVGLRVADLAPMPPMSTWVALVGATFAEEADRTVDGTMFMAAMVAGVETRGLETRGEVRDALTALPLEAQVDALVQFADGIVAVSRRRAAMARLREAYSRGRTAEVACELEQGYDPVFRATVMDERNARFATRFADLAAVAPGLAAVGMAHLHGPTGMVARLRSAGFDVRHVPLS